jgi:hypothetical protein
MGNTLSIVTLKNEKRIFKRQKQTTVILKIVKKNSTEIFHFIAAGAVCLKEN